MINPTQIIWEHLTGTGTSLYTLVGTRVWSPAAPVSWRNDSAAIIFEIITSDWHTTANDAFVRVMFSCYGGNDTYSAADAVYRALFDRLHGVIGARTASGQISFARLTDGSPGEREPETEWKYARAMYEMRVSS